MQGHCIQHQNLHSFDGTGCDDASTGRKSQMKNLKDRLLDSAQVMSSVSSLMTEAAEKIEDLEIEISLAKLGLLNALSPEKVLENGTLSACIDALLAEYKSTRNITRLWAGWISIDEEQPQDGCTVLLTSSYLEKYEGLLPARSIHQTLVSQNAREQIQQDKNSSTPVITHFALLPLPARVDDL
jgi:hypothetical protein